MSSLRHARWLALGQKIAGAGAKHARTLGPIAPAADWQQIAPAIGDVARKRWQCALDAGNALTQTALEEQNAWSAGTAEATSNWFRDATGAKNGVADEPVTKMWCAFAEQWNNAGRGYASTPQRGDTHPAHTRAAA